MLRLLNVRLFHILGEYTLFVFNVCRIVFTKPPRLDLICGHLYEIGVRSLPVVAMTGFSTGLVLAAQSFFQLSDKGLEGTTGIMVGKAMVTELGPVLTAFMITGRIGASMCAEIATMKVTEQIDALETLSIHPTEYLAIPRILSGTFMTPPLTIFSVAAGIFGGYLISTFYFNMPRYAYFNPIATYITHLDIMIGIIKSVIFGILISTISCFSGMRASNGAAGVGQSTIKSVVICYTCILCFNFIITIWLNSLGKQ